MSDDPAGSQDGSGAGPGERTTIIYPLKSLLGSIQPAHDQPEIPSSIIAAQNIDGLLHQDTSIRSMTPGFTRGYSTTVLPSLPNSAGTPTRDRASSEPNSAVALFPSNQAIFGGGLANISPLPTSAIKSPLVTGQNPNHQRNSYFPPMPKSSNIAPSLVNAVAEPQTVDESAPSAARKQAEFALSNNSSNINSNTSVQSDPTTPSITPPSVAVNPPVPYLYQRSSISAEVSQALTNAISGSSIGDQQRDRLAKCTAPRNLADFTILDAPQVDQSADKSSSQSVFATPSSGTDEGYLAKEETGRGASGARTRNTGGSVSGSVVSEDQLVSQSGDSISEADAPVTIRYKYVQDPYGNHLVLGREGVATRCEDEPIHMPGAIQSHGALIVLEENIEDGSLLVRQVSENSEQVLGLSPAYLFSLDCFSETIVPEHQDLFWRNMAFLDDPNFKQDETESMDDAEFPWTPDRPPAATDFHSIPGQRADANTQQPPKASKKELPGPEVFLVSGFVQPMTTDPNEYRPQWKAWCAAHRPTLPNHLKGQFTNPITTTSGEGSQGSSSSPVQHLNALGDTDSDSLTPSGSFSNSRFGYPPDYCGIICLEFELQNDLENPLYPPPFERRSGTGSPVSGSRSSGSSGQGGGRMSSGSGSGPRVGSAQGGASSGSNTTPMVSSGTSIAPMPGTSKGSPSIFSPSSLAPLTSAAVRSLPVSNDHNMAYLNQAAMPSTQSLFEESYAEASPTPPPQDDAIVEAGGATIVVNGVGDADDEFDSDDSDEIPGTHTWYPSPQDIAESTTSYSRPIKALEKMRTHQHSGHLGVRSPLLARMHAMARSRMMGVRGARGMRGGGRGGGFSQDSSVGSLDVFAVLQESIQQLGECSTLERLLKVIVGIVKDLTQFHRILVYQFDEVWNGQVVAELLDWNQSHDLYQGLHFPASDIPAQARALYQINKVRSLYDRDSRTARLIGRTEEDLKYPLDMTHCLLRAMSPIHLKYLGNMGVRSSMSVSITAFGQLWGLITCHSYGEQGMRVSFPVRQLLRLFSDSVSKNIERLSYAQRLQTRKLISTMPNDQNPSGYILSSSDDLLSLFDADYGILAIGDGAKILGSNEHGTELLIVAQYLRMKQFTLVQVSQNVLKDFPDINLTGIDIIAGMLFVPLSKGGRDFFVLLRKGQLRDVFWAGRPRQNKANNLEPRSSFKAWGHTVMGRCRAWTDEQIETAGILALVYGKFIEVWREKEAAVKNNQLASLLLTNASHEVRTPLNQIINFLELALEGKLEHETRKNLETTHAASKSLLFTINDLLDLTRLETGHATSATEAFDLPELVRQTVRPYESSANSRGIKFTVNTAGTPQWIVGDSKKIATVIANLTANAVKYTNKGSVSVECHPFSDPNGAKEGAAAVKIVVADTGCGIKTDKLQRIFRVLEQVEPAQDDETKESSGLGLGLAVVARIVEQVHGQLRVDSSDEGSRFSFLLPFTLPNSTPIKHIAGSPGNSSRAGSSQDEPSEIDSWVSAFSSHQMQGGDGSPSSIRLDGEAHRQLPSREAKEGSYEVKDSRMPIRAVKVDRFDMDKKSKQLQPVQGSPPKELPKDMGTNILPSATSSSPIISQSPVQRPAVKPNASTPSLRILVVDDDPVNVLIMVKRLTKDGHKIETDPDGDLAVKRIQQDPAFDCILMDIQMPIKNGFEATRDIRALEREGKIQTNLESHQVNGRIPIIAVSASLESRQRAELLEIGLDGWILKPVKFDRTRTLLLGISDLDIRQNIMYSPTRDWEHGGWLYSPRESITPTL